MTEADVAALVLAHRAPEDVARLIHSLDCPWIDTFVHVDAKTPAAPFRRACRGAGAEFLPTAARRRVRWGGFSLLAAILTLMRHAHARGPYRRYVLLSGADLLIKPLPRVREILMEPTEFIRVDRELTARSPRLNRYHFRDAPPRVQLLFGDRIPRRVAAAAPIYHGSTWWALTGGAVAHVLRVLDADPAHLRFHRFTSCPDEIVIHTALKSSPFAPRISHDHTLAPDHAGTSGDVHGTHHIVWPHAAAYSPRDLVAADIAALRASPACFARKIGPASGEVVRAFAGCNTPPSPLE